MAVNKWILGIRPVWKGLLIDPCLPTEWVSAEITRIYRGVTYHIFISKTKEI